MARGIALFDGAEGLAPRHAACSMQPPTIDDIRAAAERIDGAVDPHADADAAGRCREIIGAEVWLKFENLQFTAAYKERGALNKLLQLTPEERARGVIAASAGNHAQAVAYHGKRLGIPVTIVMPRDHADDQGHADRGPWRARSCSTATMFDDAYAKARELEAEEGYVFVHPFDDPQVIAGPGHGRARNARGRARARHARRPDRRRRADVGHRRSPRARSSRTSS